jgi:diguanylate cyclase (GGDEF)-like protein/PAS domain S-box-containing protein
VNNANTENDPQRNLLPVLFIAAATIITILVSFYCLSSGTFIIFQNLFYIPIILSCVYYSMRGFVYSVGLAIIYFFLILAFASESGIIVQALVRVFLFITIAGVVTFLSVQRKRLEEVLQEEREKFQTVADFTYDWVYWTDPQRNLIYISPSCERISGYRSEEFMNDAELLNRIVHPDDQDTFRCHADEFHKLMAEATGEVEFRIVNRNDKEHWIVHLCQPVYDNKGQFLGRCSSNRDVTERKQAEMLLRESEDRYKTMVESSNDGVALVDGDYHIYVNQKFLDIFGYEKPEDIIGKSSYMVIHPDDRKMVLEYNRKRQSGEPVPAKYEFKGIRKDGTTVFIEVSVAKSTYNGKPVSLAYLRDVTERKQAEEMILNERKKFVTLSENAPFAMVLIDNTGNITYVNPKFKELFGYDIEDIPDGRTWFKKAYPDPEYRKTVISAWVEDLKQSKAGQKRPRIFTLTCKNGKEKIVNFVPVQLETGEHVMSCNDITEQKRFEEKLQNMSITDELTGLYNRRGFFTLSQQQIKVAERAKNNMLLFFADLDKMKQVNDTLGHQEGDKALIEIATILKEVFRESDIIGRIGGDEFAVLAIDTTDETREVLIMRLHNTLDDYNRPEGRNYQLSLSTGIAHYDPEKPSTLDELMAQADELMYEEKGKLQD